MAVCIYTPITDWLGEALIKYSKMVSEMKYHKDNFPKKNSVWNGKKCINSLVICYKTWLEHLSAQFLFLNDKTIYPYFM